MIDTTEPGRSQQISKTSPSPDDPVWVKHMLVVPGRTSGEELGEAI